MSKAYSTDLINLIKALSPGEKGYIKKFALRSSTKGNHLYLDLFNDIDRQKVYNERLILKKAKYAGQLPQLKKYLYSVICKALDSYHAESSPKLQLIKMISTIEILYQKGLEDQCRKLLVNAKKIARANELYPFLIELLHLEKLIIIATEGELEKKLDKIYEERQEHMNNFKITCNHALLNQKIRMVAVNNSLIRTTNELVEHEKFLDYPLT